MGRNRAWPTFTTFWFFFTAVSPGVARASLLLDDCLIYLAPHSSMIAEFAKPNPFESLASKIYRGNLRRMNLDFFFMEGGSATVPTHVVDFEIKVMKAYYDRNPAGRELFGLLFGGVSSRADVEAWTARHVPNHKIAWIDDLQKLDQSTDVKLRQIAERVGKVRKTDKLVAENGFIDHLFYFELIENGYIPITNDHDLSVHLLQFQDARGRTVLKRLNRKIIDEFRDDPALNREFAEADGQNHDFKWQPNVEDARRIDQLLSIWEVMQENRITWHPESGTFSMMGGVFTAFSPTLLKGSGGSDLISGFRWFAGYFASGKMVIGDRGPSWRIISDAFAAVGFPNATPSEVATAVRGVKGYLSGVGSRLLTNLEKRGTGNIGTTVDRYFDLLVEQMDFKMDADNLVDKTPQNVRQLRMSEAARRIFTQEKYQHALVDAILDAI